MLVAPPFCPGLFWGKLSLSPLLRKQLLASKTMMSFPWLLQLLHQQPGVALKKPSKQTVLRNQLLRRRQVEVVHADHVEEGLGPNVDEEVVDADREDDLEQAMLMTTAKTMKLAKKMFRLPKTVDVARDGRREDADLVVERCEEEVVQKMVMCRCGWGG